MDDIQELKDEAIEVLSDLKDSAKNSFAQDKIQEMIEELENLDCNPEVGH